MCSFAPDLLQKPSLRGDLRIGRQIRDERGRVMTVIQDPVLKGLQHPGYRVSARTVELLPSLDGHTSLDELPALLESRYGLCLSQSDLRKVIEGLVRYDLLETPELQDKRATIEAEFRHSPIRPPCDLTDALYPKDPSALMQAIEDCFTPSETTEDISAYHATPRGLILPHGSLQVSGRTTARALHSLLYADIPLPALYIIIGPNHVYAGSPQATTITQPFQTPLGLVEVDCKAQALLQDLAGDVITMDVISHYRDHSIEMELPFLQWVHRERSSSLPVSIIPLLITGTRHRPGMSEDAGHWAVWDQLARALARFLTIYPKPTVLIASGDLTHWGPLFNFMPFAGKTDADFYAWDSPLLKAVSQSDSESFLTAWSPTNCCAGRPVHIVLKALEGVTWSLTNYHIAWTDANALSVASYAGFARSESC